MTKTSRRILHIFGVALLQAIAASLPASGTDVFTPTTSGTFDANNGSNWSGGVPNGGSGDVDFQENFSGNPTLFATNFLANNPGSINYLRMITTNGNLTVTTASGVNFFSEFGGVINTGDTFVVNGGSMGWSQGNNSFNDTGGTLIISNGGSVFVNLGANAMQNTGTIQLNAGNGQVSQLNYGQATGGAFTNESNGIIIQNTTGTGTGAFVGNFGANNIAFVNAGTITVNGGTLFMNTASATTAGGFSNLTSGVVNINNGSTFLITRASGSGAGWSGSDAANMGTIILSGNSQLGALNNGNTFTSGSGSLRNNGTITGNGTVSVPLFDNQSGHFIANGGTLTFTGAQNGSSATWISTNVGAQVNVLNFAMGSVATLTSATMTYSNGEVEISNGTTLLAPNTLNRNDGTLAVAGSTFTYNNQSLTNSATGLITGNGTLISGNLGGNLGVDNLGTIIADGGSLIIRAGSAANFGGFQNGATGFVQVNTNSVFGVNRYNTSGSGGWEGSGIQPTNFGKVFMNGGSIQMFVDASTQDHTKTNVNASTGLIFGNGTLDYIVQNNGTVEARSGALVLVDGVATIGAGTWVSTNFGGVASTLTFDTGSANLSGSGNSLLNSNGTVSVIGGAQLTLPTTYFRNDGTVVLSGSTITYGNVSGLQSFTNSATGVITGNGTLITANGFNYGMINFGTIVANGGALIYQAGSATNFGGFVNAAGATVQVNTGAMFGISRYVNNGWNSNPAIPTNAGTIFMNGGSLQTGDDPYTADNSRNIVNASGGLITGNGTLDFTLLNNAGATLTANSGTLDLTRLPTQTGNIEIDSGSTLAISTNTMSPATAATFTNSGTILSYGGLMTFNNSFTGHVPQPGRDRRVWHEQSGYCVHRGDGFGHGKEPEFRQRRVDHCQQRPVDDQRGGFVHAGRLQQCREWHDCGFQRRDVCGQQDGELLEQQRTSGQPGHHRTEWRYRHALLQWLRDERRRQREHWYCK